MIKAVLFDMDGVLYDSMRSHAQAWYDVISSLGIKCTHEEFYLYEGRTGYSTINLLFKRAYGREATEKEKHDIYEMKSDRFNELEHHHSKPMEGVKDLLNKVKAEGLKRVIVTGSGQRSLLDRLNNDFPGIFSKERMVTAYDVEHGKPDPEPYLKGLTTAGVNNKEALVVENAPLGVEAGVAAGIFTIAVNTGPLSDQVLLDAGADALYHDMPDLKEDFDGLLEKINEKVR